MCRFKSLKSLTCGREDFERWRGLTVFVVSPGLLHLIFLLQVKDTVQPNLIEKK